MTIRAEEHQAPYEGELSLNWNWAVRPKMRVGSLELPQRRDYRQPPEWQLKISQRRNSRALARAQLLSMKSTDPRRTLEVCSVYKSKQPMRPGAEDKGSSWIAR